MRDGYFGATFLEPILRADRHLAATHAACSWVSHKRTLSETNLVVMAGTLPESARSRIYSNPRVTIIDKPVSTRRLKRKLQNLESGILDDGTHAARNILRTLARAHAPTQPTTRARRVLCRRTATSQSQTFQRKIS